MYKFRFVIESAAEDVVRQAKQDAADMWDRHLAEGGELTEDQIQTIARKIFSNTAAAAKTISRAFRYITPSLVQDFYVVTFCLEIERLENNLLSNCTEGPQ